MSSPVRIPFDTLILLDRESNQPIFLQIAFQLVNAIQRGILVSGTKLPGTRNLSVLLNVHRKTIISAFDELESQGWIEVVPNIGAFVLSNESSLPLHNKFKDKSIYSYPTSAGYSFQKNILLDTTHVSLENKLFFTDGLPDARLAPLTSLSRAYSANINRLRNSRFLSNSNKEGSEYLRKMLVHYLNNSRGLAINIENITTTRGIEMALYLLSELLLEPGDLVIVGDLSYYITNMVFQKAGATLLSVPVDEYGICVDAVRKLCEKQKIRMLYLTPHHHYPTTVTLSASRRVELLALSKQYGFIILEDDYDFHYSSSPVLPLASADEDGMVVYVGSFCKSLAPGFRLGYVVAPENLIIELNKFKEMVDHGDVYMELSLAELLEEGEIQRHLKKSLKIYQKRRDVFCDLLRTNLSEFISFSTPSGGLAVWTEWDKELNLMRISRLCEAKGLILPRILLYQTEKLTAARLGFGNMTSDEMKQAIEIMAEVILLEKANGC